jgi:hypothetical protein
MSPTTLSKFSTVALPPSRRAGAWRDCMSEVYYPFDATPKDPGSFQGALIWLQLSRVGLSHFSANALHTVCHASSPIPDEYAFIFPIRQSFRYGQRSIEDSVNPGEMVLLGSTCPYWTRIGDTDENVTIKIPASAMREQVPSIEDGFGRRNLANPHLVPILSQLVFQTLRISPSASIEVINRAEECILNLLYTAI